MNNEGIGIGLTIVKQLVELNQGEIGVHSDGHNKGSVFYFTMQMEPVETSISEKDSLSQHSEESKEICIED